MHGLGVSTVTAYTAHREWATRPPDERYASVQALYEAARATTHPHRRARHRDRATSGPRRWPTDALALRDASGRHGRIDALELRAARRHRRRAAEVPPHAARADRVERDQLRAAAAATRAASAVRRSGRTVDRARDHLAAVRAGPPRRAGRPGARPHGQPPGLAPAARLQGRRVSAPNGFRPAPTWEIETCSCSSWTATVTSTTPPTAPQCRPVPRVHPPEQRRRSRRPHPGCVPVPRRVRESHHLGLSARRRLPAPARGRVDSGRVDDSSLASRPRGPRRRPADDRAMLLRATTQELGADARRRCSTRSCSDSICRRSRPPRRTRWRNSTRRIPVPSGATCRD